MKISLYLKEGINDLFKNKGRTFLTSLGIIIGVYSVVLLLSFGEGLKIYINQQFESLGSNQTYVLPGKITGGSRTMLGGVKFTLTDFRRLKARLTNSQIIPITTKNVTLETSTKTQSATLLGGTTEIFPMLNLTLRDGRYFSRSDEGSGRKVAVMGSKVAEEV